MRGAALFFLQQIIPLCNLVLEGYNQFATLMGAAYIFVETFVGFDFFCALSIGLFFNFFEFLLLIGVWVFQGNNVDALTNLHILLDVILDLVKDGSLRFPAIPFAFRHRTHFLFSFLIIIKNEILFKYFKLFINPKNRFLHSSPRLSPVLPPIPLSPSPFYPFLL